MGLDGVLISSHGPWQNSYVERLIGSIRRECLNHMIVLIEEDMRTILSDNLRYYHGWRTYISLEMDAPDRRNV
jgi:transposase InsO family protein